MYMAFKNIEKIGTTRKLTEGWPGRVTKTSYLRTHRWSPIQVLINWARRRVTWFIVTNKTISQLILIYKFVLSATKSTTFVSLINFGKHGPYSIILSTLLARPAILSSKFIYIRRYAYISVLLVVKLNLGWTSKFDKVATCIWSEMLY